MLVVLIVWFGGCRRAPSAQDDYDAVHGVVITRRADTGRMTVRVDAPNGGKYAGRELACRVTSLSEIYVNDRVRDLAAVKAEDRVQLIGYVDPREAEFVVTLANVHQSAPEPPRPMLPLATDKIDAPGAREKE